MSLPEYWWLWGLGWLLLPRFTAAFMLRTLTGYDELGLILMIFGVILDLFSGSKGD